MGHNTGLLAGSAIVLELLANICFSIISSALGFDLISSRLYSLSKTPDACHGHGTRAFPLYRPSGGATPHDL
jgi:hypothetical protein